MNAISIEYFHYKIDYKTKIYTHSLVPFYNNTIRMIM